MLLDFGKNGLVNENSKLTSCEFKSQEKQLDAKM